MPSDRLRSIPTGAFALSILLLLLPASLTGQETGAVSGTVVEQGTQNPLSGAQISVEGLQIGTLTNESGQFTLRGVPTGSQTLRVQLIGYEQAEQTVTVDAGQTASVEFAIRTSAVEMEELVVTGTGGEVQRSQLGNTISTIDASQTVNNSPVTSVDELLQGRSAGVDVDFNSGTVGTGGTINIRGTSSIALNSTPVVYIDGVRVDASADDEIYLGGQDISRLQDLNPSEIDRIEVVKGAAAATLYGTQGSNGVIQIFTKEGQAGETQWTFKVEQGFERLPTDTFPGRMFTQFVNPDNGFRARDPKQEVRNGHHQSYFLSARGGGGDARFYLSGSFERAEGSVTPKVNWNNDAAGRVNLDVSLTEDLTLDSNVGVVFNQLRIPEGDNGLHGVYSSLDVGVPYTATPERPYGERFGSFEAVQANKKVQTVLRSTSGITLRHNPSPELSQSLTFGFDWYNSEFSDYFPFGYEGVGHPQGSKEINDKRVQDLTLDYKATWSSDVSEEISSSLTVGTQGNFSNRVNVRSEGSQFPGPGTSTVNSAALTEGTETRVQEVNAGVFGQERIGFWDRLYLNLGLRADGNSAFGGEFTVALYPKASLAYNISNEDFWPSDVISTMKLRAAYGQSGLAPAQFAADRTYAPVSAKQGSPAVTPANRGNPDLGPETSEEYSAGFDAGLWGDRVGVNFTVYQQRTKDALIDKQFPPSEGFLQQQLTNIGEIENKGVELSVDGVLVQEEEFNWRTQLSLTGQENTVTDMGEIEEINIGGFSGIRVREGYPVQSIWGYVMESWDPESRQHTASDTVVYKGHANPTWTGALNTSFTYDRFTFRAMGNFELGAHKNNFTRWWNTRIRTGDDYLSLVEQPHGTPTPAADSLVDYVRTVGTQVFVSPRDFLASQELSLEYRVPGNIAGMLGMDRATVRLSARRLEVWHNFTGISPQANAGGGSSLDRGGEFNTVPPAKTFMLTVQTSF